MPGSPTALRRLASPALRAALWLLWSLSAAAGPAGPHISAAALVPTVASPAPGPGAQTRLHKGILLVASRNLNDPNFAKTVVLLVGYGAGGAVGIIVNRPTGMPAAHLLPEYKQLSTLDAKVLFGGPVGLNTVRLLMHNGPQVHGSLEVFPGAYLVDSKQSLKKVLAHHAKNVQLRFYAGYAGWAPGQLDAEVRRGDWYTWRADLKTVFDKPAASIWPDLVLDAGGQWVRKTGPRRKSVALCATQAIMGFSPDHSMIFKGSGKPAAAFSCTPDGQPPALLGVAYRGAFCETVHVSSAGACCPIALLL